MTAEHVEPRQVLINRISRGFIGRNLWRMMTLWGVSAVAKLLAGPPSPEFQNIQRKNVTEWLNTEFCGQRETILRHNPSICTKVY